VPFRGDLDPEVRHRTRRRSYAGPTGAEEIVSMRVFFNGQPHDVGEGTTIAMLLHHFELQPRYVAVEVNLELVPRERHEHHVLQAEDRLEVVTLVGGG
jgi:thiamine biosynthesis protein ThiS